MLIDSFKELMRSKGPLQYAKGSFEQDVVFSAYRPIEKYLDRVPNHARRLAFRADFLPRICREAVKELYPRHGYALGLFNCYRLAGERTFSEYIFRRREYFKQFSRPKVSSMIEHYLNGPDNLWFWEKRFDEWLQSAINSWDFFLKKQAGTLFKPSRKELEATLTGIIARHVPSKTLDLTPVVDPEMVSRFLKVKEADTQHLRCRRLLVDSWLLEIWPIVTQYHWNHQDVQKAISESGVIDPDGFFEKAAQVKDRCKKVLNLKLSPKVKRGRPFEPRKSKRSNADIYYRPPLFHLAKIIHPISLDVRSWFTGPFGNIEMAFV